jgi:hypothetical protein
MKALRFSLVALIISGLLFPLVAQESTSLTNVSTVKVRGRTSVPSLSTANNGVFYYDNTTDKLKLSLNGASFKDFATVTAGTNALTATNPTNHGLLVGNGDQTVDALSVGASGTVLHGNTGADPTFSAVDLTADVTGILPPANGGVANNATSGAGGFFGVSIHLPSNIASAAIETSANKVRALQFVLPFRAVISKVNTEITGAGGAGSKYGVALYDSGKNLLVQSGALAADRSAAIYSDSFGPVTLPAGVYYFAYTSDSTSLTLRLYNGTGLAALIENAGVARIGNSANDAPTPGTFPSALGTITSLQLTPLLAYFEP